MRDRALFDLAIDGQLRGCDVMKVKIGDPVPGGQLVQLPQEVEQQPIELRRLFPEGCMP